MSTSGSASARGSAPSRAAILAACDVSSIRRAMAVLKRSPPKALRTMVVANSAASFTAETRCPGSSGATLMAMNDTAQRPAKAPVTRLW
jgi:hypothetical protein